MTQSPMIAGCKVTMLNGRSMNLRSLNWQGGALIRCICWLNEAAPAAGGKDAGWGEAWFSDWVEGLHLNRVG